MITAKTVTISKLGPSGSFTKKKSPLEHRRDITPRIMSVVFLGLGCMGGLSN